LSGIRVSGARRRSRSAPSGGGIAAHRAVCVGALCCDGACRRPRFGGVRSCQWSGRRRGRRCAYRGPRPRWASCSRVIASPCCQSCGCGGRCGGWSCRRPCAIMVGGSPRQGRLRKFCERSWWYYRRFVLRLFRDGALSALFAGLDRASKQGGLNAHLDCGLVCSLEWGRCERSLWRWRRRGCAWWCRRRW
jgi:hypothetical protein